MERKFIFVIAITLLRVMEDGALCDNEQIKFFLKDFEVTQVREIEPTLYSSKFMTLRDMVKSFEMQMKGKNLKIDLRNFYPLHHVAAVEYISKSRNASGDFLSNEYRLYQGQVRNLKDSFVLGFFTSENAFRGYIMMDEIYCVEPYSSVKSKGQKGTVIVYKLMDVIAPGCKKTEGKLPIDCSKAKYYLPGKALNPPPLPKEMLYADDFFEERFDWNENTVEDDRDEDHANMSYKSQEKSKVDGEGQKDTNNDQRFPKTHKKGNDYKDKKHSHKDHHEKELNKTEVGSHSHKHGNYSRKKHNKNYDESDSADYLEEAVLESKNSLPSGFNLTEIARTLDNLMSLEYIISSFDETDNEIDTERQNRNEGYGEKLFENSYNQNVKISKEKKILKRETNKEEQMEHVCDIEAIIDPSMVKKFHGRDDDVVKDIYIQTQLLNKIFEKVKLKKEGGIIHSVFHINKIVTYADHTHSPFSHDTDLKYFTENHREARKYCLSIAFVNKQLKSKEIFEGYIPKVGGGVCSRNGNVILVSHGDTNAPAPMALYFAAYLRAVTRAFGAADTDKDCQKGNPPNPMEEIQKLILGKSFDPPKSISIFSSCNVQDIIHVLRKKDCFQKIKHDTCGNGIREENEICDCGPSFVCDSIDSCCTPAHSADSRTKGCLLRNKAKCSITDGCCSNCQIINQTVKCFSGNNDCDIGMCDGKTASCPKGQTASLYMVCGEQKRGAAVDAQLCENGVCSKSLCASKGLLPCSCANVTGKSCMYCCMKDGKCLSATKDLKLYSGKHFFLEDGTDCPTGTCLNGLCKPKVGRLAAPNVVHPESTRRKISGTARLEVYFLPVITCLFSVTLNVNLIPRICTSSFC
ncbi:uncharacterized protein LOC118185997 [Stegodyphus dumicola]|uniref:uncharacterized protein LOC118185997 n=1 Tax=Stegodyphus dumicola TaxID=202533 RepID=UPI0015A9AC8A|nr:uncharacterized protein LOC118185997 [Stegodyphus dumicola]